jgi:hypothetical protein
MLALRVALGTLWGGMLFIAGLSVATRWAMTARSPDLVRMVGVGLAASGMYVFSMVVADRLFPRVDPRLSGAVQLLLGVLLLAGAVCFAACYWDVLFPPSPKS